MPWRSTPALPHTERYPAVRDFRAEYNLQHVYGVWAIRHTWVYDVVHPLEELRKRKKKALYSHVPENTAKRPVDTDNTP